MRRLPKPNEAHIIDQKEAGKVMRQAAGASWEQFHEAFRFVDYVVAVLVVAAVAAVGWRFARRRRQPRADGADEPI